MNYSHSPLVLGATGGLGTNAIMQICLWNGYFMLHNNNKINNVTDFTPFYDKWFDISLSNNREPLNEQQNRQMFLDFQDCIQTYRERIPDKKMRWGWKNSRSIYFLSYFHLLFPTMKFVHIIRDGRDVAFSPIHEQVLKHAKVLIGKKLNNLPIPYIMMNIWKNTNFAVASYGEQNMKNNYLRIRFEDLCENPTGILKVLIKFLELPQVDIPKLAETIRKPPTIGKWHMYPIDLINEMEEIGKESLIKFGYL